jgi:uncharacterized protein YjbJ (UPF0337 family)
MTAMNEAQTQGADQLSAKIKQTWGRLSDADIALAKTQKEQFYDKLKATYGLSREDAQKRLGELEKTCGCGASTHRAA